jgi:hypothetical protein
MRIRTPLVVLAALALLSCKSTMGSVEREIVGLACEAQCPTLYALSVRGCEAIDEEEQPALRDICFAEALAVYRACPDLCGLIRVEPETEVSE